MNLEKQVREMFRTQRSYYFNDSDVPWPGSPFSERHPSCLPWFVSSLDAKEVDDSIHQADLAYCLSSPVEYIRECKKWYLALLV